MAILIDVSERESWLVQRWWVERLVDSTATRLGTAEDVERLHRGLAYSHINFRGMAPDERGRIARAMRAAVVEVCAALRESPERKAIDLEAASVFEEVRQA